MIAASPRPPIDVWYMLQAGTRGLLHGHDIYSVAWTSGIPHEVSNHFTYLPGTAVVLAPFYAIFGDVRFGLVTAIIVTSLLIGRMGRSDLAPYIGCLLLIAPKADYLLEYAWIDPLLLLAVTGGVLALRKNHVGWAVVAFAAALTIKQYALLLLPVGIMCRSLGPRRMAMAGGLAAIVALPWAAVNPGAFWAGTVVSLLHAARRTDSLSLFPFLVSHGVRTTFVLPAASLVVLFAALAWRRTGSVLHFALGMAAAMAVFDLTGSNQFFNEWELAAGYCLLVLGVSLSDGPRPPPLKHRAVALDSEATTAEAPFSPDRVERPDALSLVPRTNTPARHRADRHERPWCSDVSL